MREGSVIEPSLVYEYLYKGAQITLAYESPSFYSEFQNFLFFYFSGMYIFIGASRKSNTRFQEMK